MSERMPRTYSLDVRGMRCPIPYVRAKPRVPDLGPGDTLIVLFTDPEARIDLAALAHDEELAIERDGERLTLTRPPRPAAGRRRR